MKKTSILLIALSLFAMIFSGCSMLVPDDPNAGFEDFQGTWYWNAPSENTSDGSRATSTLKSLIFEIKDNTVTMTIDGSKDSLSLTASVSNGILTAKHSFLPYSFNMKIKQTKTMITVTGDCLMNLVGDTVIYLTRALDFKDLPFTPDIHATFTDYEGTWTSNDGKVSFIFESNSIANQNLQLVNVVGLGSNSVMPGFVIVAKGVATTKLNDNMYMMYMNEKHTGITVTGPTIKQLTGGYYLNLDKRN